MDYCKICKSKLEYLGKCETAITEVLPPPIFYCPTCRKDIKQVEVLRFEDLMLDEIFLLKKKLFLLKKKLNELIELWNSY